MERQPVVGEFWFLLTHRGNKEVGYLDPHNKEFSLFTTRVSEGWFPDIEGMDKSVEAPGSGVPVRDIERPATKEEIQAWIDMWGMPKTFKGQPEYPLGEKDDKIPESAPVQPLPELIDPFTVDWKESDFKGETHAALKPNYMKLPGGDREYWIYDLEYAAERGAKTGIVYPIVDRWDEEHNFVSYPGRGCLTFVGHLVPGSKVKEYEAAKAETQPIQEPVKLYEPHEREIKAGNAVSTDRFVETGEIRLPTNGEWYGGIFDNQKFACKAPFDFNNIKYEILKPYTPTIHPVIVAITEDLLAKEYAEAKKKVKEAKERATAIREIIRLEGVIKKSAQCKAELTKKWLS